MSHHKQQPFALGFHHVGPLFLLVWLAVPLWCQSSDWQSSLGVPPQLSWENLEDRQSLTDDLADPKNQQQPSFRFVEEDLVGTNHSEGLDRDYSFILIKPDGMHFQTIVLSGQTVDRGSIRRREAEQLPNRSELSDALLAAAAKGDASLMRDLIDQGADVNVRDTREWSTYGFTALMWAAMEGHQAAARLLLDSGAEVDAGDRQDGATALMRAADSNRVETARLLLERGADVNTRDRHGYTVLMGASEQGRHNRMVELLLRHGGEVNARHPIDGTDALMLAADEGHLSTMKILLAAGANAQAGDSHGRTALMRAVETERPDIARVLIEAHADPHQADREGETALQEAIERANPELLHVLRKTNIDRRQDRE